MRFLKRCAPLFLLALVGISLHVLPAYSGSYWNYTPGPYYNFNPGPYYNPYNPPGPSFNYKPGPDHSYPQPYYPRPYNPFYRYPAPSSSPRDTQPHYTDPQSGSYYGFPKFGENLREFDRHKKEAPGYFEGIPGSLFDERVERYFRR